MKSEDYWQTRRMMGASERNPALGAELLRGYERAEANRNLHGFTQKDALALSKLDAEPEQSWRDKRKVKLPSGKHYTIHAIEWINDGFPSPK